MTLALPNAGSPFRVFLTGLTLAASLASATGCDGGGNTPKTFDSFDALREAAEEAPGFTCEDVITAEAMGEEISANFESKFAGLTDFGACITDGKTRYVIVFEKADALEGFVESDLWVGFERIFVPVVDGQTFTGVTGKNWIITDFEADSDFLEELGAEQVDSQPAIGDSPD